MKSLTSDNLNSIQQFSFVDQLPPVVLAELAPAPADLADGVPEPEPLPHRVQVMAIEARLSLHSLSEPCIFLQVCPSRCLLIEILSIVYCVDKKSQNLFKLRLKTISISNIRKIKSCDFNKPCLVSQAVPNLNHHMA